MSDEKIIDKLLFAAVESSKDVDGCVNLPDFIEKMTGFRRDTDDCEAIVKRIKERVLHERLAARYLGNYIKVTPRTHEICRNGGYIVVSNNETSDKDLHRESLRASIKYNKTTRRTAIVAAVLSLLALLVSIYALFR